LTLTLARSASHFTHAAHVTGMILKTPKPQTVATPESAIEPIRYDWNGSTTAQFLPLSDWDHLKGLLGLVGQFDLEFLIVCQINANGQAYPRRMAQVLGTPAGVSVEVLRGATMGSEELVQIHRGRPAFGSHVDIAADSLGKTHIVPVTAVLELQEALGVMVQWLTTETIPAGYGTVRLDF
jgi:hypothetical protein